MLAIAFTLARMCGLGSELRKAIVERSKQVLGWYYFWGGRSAFVSQLWDKKTILTGLDCSGHSPTLSRFHEMISF